MLFDRNAGGPATLTPAGRKLHDSVGAKMTAIQAAVQGLGALVVPEAFVRAMFDIEALRCLSMPVDSGSYSYAIGRRQAFARVTIFTDWLKEAGHLENENSVSLRGHKTGFS